LRLGAINLSSLKQGAIEFHAPFSNGFARFTGAWTIDTPG